MTATIDIMADLGGESMVTLARVLPRERRLTL